MQKFIVKYLIGFFLVSFLAQIAACGTLLHPERRGQKSGEIDVKIAALDGLLLILGIIPGVVAYVIDFDTGAIYLPRGKRNVVMLEDRDVTVIHVNPELLKNPEAVKEIVAKEMDLPVTVDWSKLETSNIKPEQIKTVLAEAKAVGYAR